MTVFMARYEITNRSLGPIGMTTFAEQSHRARSDLQGLLRENITVVAPDTYVLAQEFGVGGRKAPNRFAVLG